LKKNERRRGAVVMVATRMYATEANGLVWQCVSLVKLNQI